VEKTIAVVAEHAAGRTTRATYEALACAREIACIQPSKIFMVVLGDEADEVGRKIADFANVSVVGVRVPGLKAYDGDAYRGVLAEVLAALDVSLTCVPGTTQGLDFAPGLAVKLGASCVGNVERVLEQDGQPVFVRTLFNGKVVAELSPGSPTVVLVQPGSFSQERQSGDHRNSLEVRTFSWEPTRSRVLGYKVEEPADAALGDAAVILAAGRGLGRKENLDLIQRVASLFARSAVAGSRPLCDQGWLPYRRQVGQTGATVAPELYIACGISGAQQHLIGMRGSKCIVAVNTDPEANIFRHADIGIIEDVEQFLSDLLHEAETLQ